MKMIQVALLLPFMTVTVLAQLAAKPNFSGTWILDLPSSKLEYKDAPVASTFNIQHHEPNFHLQRTHVYKDGQHDTWGIDLITDGKHEVVRKDGDNREVTRMYWDGDTLVLDEKATAPDGSSGTNLVRYSLSQDGKTMTALEHEEYPGGKLTNRWVFKRKDTPGRN